MPRAPQPRPVSGSTCTPELTPEVDRSPYFWPAWDKEVLWVGSAEPQGIAGDSEKG